MKTKVTNKEVRNCYSTIISLGYCDAQSLLSGINPFGYNCGIYGWNCDFYDVDGICICYGYRTIGKSVDYNLLREYEQKAKPLSSLQRYELLKESINLNKIKP